MAKVQRSSSVALARELRFAAQAQVARSLADEPTWGLRRDTPILRSVVQDLRPDGYLAAPRDTLSSVLMAAIARIGDDSLRDYPLTFQWAALRLFGYEPAAVPPATGQEYNQLVAEVRERANLLPTEKQKTEKLTRAVRERVARELLTMVDEQARSAPSGGCGGLAEVPRPKLEAKIVALLSSGSGPVALWGESGNGKTYLANRIAREHFHELRVAVLRGPSGGRNPFLDADMAAALRLSGRRLEPVSELQIRLAMQHALRTEGAFDLVILDNADDWMLDNLLPDAAVPVLLTTRTRSNRSWIRYLRVPTFSKDEADTYVSLLLPDESTEGLAQLASRLARRPLALYVASRVVQLEIMSLPDLLVACRDEPVRTVQVGMDVAAEPTVSPLNLVYATLIESLRDSKRALAVLDVILWLVGSGEISQVMACVLPRQFGVTDQLEVTGALRILESLGLIELGERDVEINTLTLEILREQRDEQIDGTLGRFYDQVLSLGVRAATAYQDGEEIDCFLDEIDRAFPDVGHPVSATQRLMAIEVASMVAALRWLAPGRDLGKYCLSEHSWLAWQKGVEWFSVDTSRRKFALFHSAESGVRMWSTAGGRQKPSYETAFTSWALTGVYQCSVGSTLSYLSGHRIYEAGPNTQSLDVFVSVNDKTVSHEAFGVIPKTVAAQHEIAIWTACGLRYIPRLLEGAERPPACPTCEMAAGDLVINPRLQGESLAAFEMTIEMDPPSVDWLSRAIVSATLGLMLIPNGAIAAFDRALVAADSAPIHERKRAAVVQLWVTKARHDVFLNENDFERASTDLRTLDQLIRGTETPPGNVATLWSNLAFDYHKHGRPNDVKELARRARAALPGVPSELAHAVETLLGLLETPD